MQIDTCARLPEKLPGAHQAPLPPCFHRLHMCQGVIRWEKGDSFNHRVFVPQQTGQRQAAHTHTRARGVSTVPPLSRSRTAQSRERETEKAAVHL